MSSRTLVLDPPRSSTTGLDPSGLRMGAPPASDRRAPEQLYLTLNWVLWHFIVFVSVWDGYLTLIHREHMLHMELNPIGLALIRWNDGGVTYLLMAKAVGTISVASVLAALLERSPRRTLAITGGVAACQLALLLFLTFR